MCVIFISMLLFLKDDYSHIWKGLELKGFTSVEVVKNSGNPFHIYLVFNKFPVHKQFLPHMKSCLNV